jgi:hypothetical protein
MPEKAMSSPTSTTDTAKPARATETGSGESLLEESVQLLKLTAHAAARTAIQEPIDAFTQLGNYLAGKEILPRLELIDPLPKTEFGSKEWVAEMVGTGIGFYIDYLLVAGATSAALKGLRGAATAAESLPAFARFIKPAQAAVTSSRLATQILLPTAKTAMDGALYGAFLIPSESDYGAQFLKDRRNNALVSAAAFGAQSALATTIMSKTAAIPALKSAVRSRFGGGAARTGSNMVGGVLGGTMDAEGAALLAGQQRASREALAAQIIQYSLIPG